MNPRSVKRVWIDLRRRRKLILQTEDMAQPLRHVFRKVIGAERQLSTSVSRPRDQRNGNRKCDSKYWEEMAEPCP
jgi:hypothetical protein